MHTRSPHQTQSLHHAGSQRAILYIVPDPPWPDMFRIQFLDGGLSDFGNIARVKDSAELIAERGPPHRNRSDLRWRYASNLQSGSLVRCAPGPGPERGST